MNANFEGHADEILSSMHKAAITALEEVGIQAEGYAKKIAPVAEYHGGDLRQSISHKVDARAQEVYIGTNVEYGVYQELGTGEYYEGEGGRHTAWCYEDKKEINTGRAATRRIRSCALRCKITSRPIKTS